MDNPDRQRLLDRLRVIELERQSLLSELKGLDKQDLLPPVPPPLMGRPALGQPPSTPEAKVALFLQLFRCRPDLYARAWENPGKGIKGYVPALKPAWQGKAGKKAGRGYDTLPADAFLPLDEEAVRAHLEGRQTIGTYAIRKDDSCVFLAADFDGMEWDADASVFVRSARDLGVEAALERSRSGEGGHAWIFFEEAVPARLARRLGTVILARASAGRTKISLASYDRFFPNQDSLPKGGFGNLIALPLQKIPRSRGNSVFVDSQLVPFPDQWSCLAAARRLSLAEVQGLVAAHEVRGSAPELPVERELREAEHALDLGLESRRPLEYAGRIRLRLANGLTLGLDADLPPGLLTAFKRSATFANPLFFEKQRLRFSTWGTPRYIFCGENLEGNLWLPRGCLESCLAWASEAGTEVVLEDERKEGGRCRFRFLGELDAEQKRALKALAGQDTGVLVAPPGAGKTVVGCALIARRKVSTLILVHRAPLMEQWKTRLKEFLGLADSEIGSLGGQRRRLTGKLDLAMIQTLSKMQASDPLFSGYGQVIVDECHHVPAASFEAVMKRFPGRYVAGLTATPFRRDGLQKIIFMQCGPLLYEAAGQPGGEMRRVVHYRETGFRLADDLGPQPPLHKVWQALIQDKERLALVAGDVAEALEKGRFPLILSERREHLDLLRQEIGALQTSARGFVLVGQMGKKERRQILREIVDLLQQGARPYLLATGSLIGEGFDLPALDTLFLSMPVAYKGKLIQYAGRLHRAHPGKSVVEIFDYLDSNLPLAMSMWRKRAKAYKGMGYVAEGV